MDITRGRLRRTGCCEAGLRPYFSLEDDDEARDVSVLVDEILQRDDIDNGLMAAVFGLHHKQRVILCLWLHRAQLPQDYIFHTISKVRAREFFRSDTKRIALRDDIRSYLREMTFSKTASRDCANSLARIAAAQRGGDGFRYVLEAAVRVYNHECPDGCTAGCIYCQEKYRVPIETLKQQRLEALAKQRRYHAINQSTTARLERYTQELSSRHPLNTPVNFIPPTRR